MMVFFLFLNLSYWTQPLIWTQVSIGFNWLGTETNEWAVMIKRLGSMKRERGKTQRKKTRLKAKKRQKQKTRKSKKQGIRKAKGYSKHQVGFMIESFVIVQTRNQRRCLLGSVVDGWNQSVNHWVQGMVGTNCLSYCTLAAKVGLRRLVTGIGFLGTGL